MTVRLRFDRMPALPLLYLRGAVARKKAPRGEFRPRIEPMTAEISGVSVDGEKLARYREACGLAAGAEHLPMSYPFVMATPLSASLVMHERFPYPVLGMVHVRQTITEHRPIPHQERLAFHCRFGDEREAKLGVEFDTVMEARVAGDLVWEATSTALIRTRTRKKGQKPGSTTREEPDWDHHEVWEVPADMGRRYAAITHDYNPIHLYPLTARLFGFKRPIVHGMWTLARCLAAMEHDLPDPPRHLDVSFRRPLYLPSSVEFRRGGERFEVKDVLRGTLGPAADQAG